MSTVHLIIILVIVLILFGTDRIPSIMKDLGKGFKSFKEGIEESTKKIDDK
jgi:sec-independent protein translocase protein TatA